MNINDWNRSSNAYEMLQFMQQHDEAEFSRKAKSIHLYLIECSRKQLKYRCGEETKHGLDAAVKHLKKFMSHKEFHDQEWIVEGAAFSTDIGMNEDYPNPYSVNFNQTKDLKMIRISRGLIGLQAQQYLMDLAYFIDKSMAYSRDSIGELPADEFSKFLCSNLLRQRFNYPVN